MKKEENISDKIFMNYMDTFYDNVIKEDNGVLFDGAEYTFPNKYNRFSEEVYQLIIKYSNEDYKEIEGKYEILNYIKNMLRIFDKHSGAPYIKDLEHLGLKERNVSSNVIPVTAPIFRIDKTSGKLTDSDDDENERVIQVGEIQAPTVGELAEKIRENAQSKIMPMIYLYVDDELNIIRKCKYTNNLTLRVAIIDINQYQDWAKEENNEYSFEKLLELFQNNRSNIESKDIKSMKLDFEFNFNTGTYSNPKLEITYQNNIGVSKHTLEGESLIYNFLVHGKYQ